MYSILFLALIFLAVNLPSYIRKHLMMRIADESNNAKNNLQTSQLNFLSKIEWLRFYPLKKLFLGILWLLCLFIATRGIFMTMNNPNKTYIFLTIFFWIITISTARKIYRYIRLSYHCVPVLNHTKTKEELKESLQGECFEKVIFKHKILSKYFHVLISEHWVIIDGHLIPRHGIEKIYYLHPSPISNYEQIRFVYSNGEKFSLPSSKETADELRQKEISNMLHKISPIVIEEAEYDKNTSGKKDKSVIYWNMNYKGKFRRTLWFIPVVIVLCFLTPLFMGRFWWIYDIILVIVLVLQLWYTYTMKKVEEEVPEKLRNDEYVLCPHCKKVIYKDEMTYPHCHSDIQEEHENK